MNAATHRPASASLTKKASNNKTRANGQRVSGRSLFNGGFRDSRQMGTLGVPVFQCLF
jgi:hypothetical protein